MNRSLEWGESPGGAARGQEWHGVEPIQHPVAPGSWIVLDICPSRPEQSPTHQCLGSRLSIHHWKRGSSFLKKPCMGSICCDVYSAYRVRWTRTKQTNLNTPSWRALRMEDHDASRFASLKPRLLTSSPLDAATLQPGEETLDPPDILDTVNPDPATVH